MVKRFKIHFMVFGFYNICFHRKKETFQSHSQLGVVHNWPNMLPQKLLD
jgi:hypothetical protein